MAAPSCQFVPCRPDDSPALAAWIASGIWPYHVVRQPTADQVTSWIERGQFWGEDARTFWIVVDEARVGIVSLQDLEDPTPVFDLRIAEAWRGRGVGRQAVQWIADYTFRETDKHRLEAHVRADNDAMRHVMRASGWVKESHARDAWPDADGTWHDALAYAVLKKDWASGDVTPVAWDPTS